MANDDGNAQTNECVDAVVAACGGTFPCIDLREDSMHHHPMVLQADGTATVGYCDTTSNPAVCVSGRTWTCTCTAADCVAGSLVGSWVCPGFYGNNILVTNAYGDDFTDQRGNEHIDVCYPATGGPAFTVSALPCRVIDPHENNAVSPHEWRSFGGHSVTVDECKALCLGEPATCTGIEHRDLSGDGSATDCIMLGGTERTCCTESTCGHGANPNNGWTIYEANSQVGR